MKMVEQTLSCSRPYAFSPPDVRIAAPCTTARLLHQAGVRRSLSAFSRAAGDCLDLTRCDPEFQGSQHLQRPSSKGGYLSLPSSGVTTLRTFGSYLQRYLVH